MKRLTYSAVFAALGILPAAAADFPVNAVKAAPAYMAPSASWTGFYLGAVGSYNWQNFTFPDPDVRQGMTPAGAMGGVTVGYDYQFAPNWVLGAIGDVQFGNIGVTAFNVGPTTTPSAVSMTEGVNEKLFATVRGRLGYLVASGLLLYGTGGLAIAQVDQNETCPSGAQFGFCKPKNYGGAGPYSLTGTQTYLGGVVGAGAEWRFAQNWSTKIEYLYSDFRPKVFNLGAAPSGVATSPRSLPLSQSTLNVGVNYHF